MGRLLVAPEEPDEGKLHVRICGEGAGTGAFTQLDRLQPALLRRFGFQARLTPGVGRWSDEPLAAREWSGGHLRVLVREPR